MYKSYSEKQNSATIKFLYETPTLRQTDKQVDTYATSLDQSHEV